MFWIIKLTIPENGERFKIGWFRRNKKGQWKKSLEKVDTHENNNRRLVEENNNSGNYIFLYVISLRAVGGSITATTTTTTY